MLCAHCSPEPTPSPSQEGSNTGWPVPLLGGVRGGLVAGTFMERGALKESEWHLSKLFKDFPSPQSFVAERGRRRGAGSSLSFCRLSC